MLCGQDSDAQSGQQSDIQSGQQSDTQSGQQSDTQSGQVSEHVLNYRKQIIEYCKTPKSSKQIREYLNLKSRNYVDDNIIKPLIEIGIIEYTNKKHLSASNQKYITKKDC